MNDPVMLLHIIQCRSNAVPSPEHRGGDAETMETLLSTLNISMVGGNQLW